MSKHLKNVFVGLLVMGFAVGCAEQEPAEDAQRNQLTETNMEQQTTNGNNNSRAIAVINPTEGNDVSGTVTFEQTGDSVHVTADLSGLQQEQHGFHVHQYGDCSASDGTSAGGHYNPEENDHGAPEDDERHIGDMGNLQAQNGSSSYDYYDSVIELNGSNSIVGHAVIVHGGQDDLQSQPSGDAGPRLGCGVVGIAEGSGNAGQ